MKTIENLDPTVQQFISNPTDENWNKLYEHLKKPIKNTVLKLTQDSVTADDLAQEVFIKIYAKLKNGSYCPQGRFISWAVRIAYNCTMDYFRNARRTREPILVPHVEDGFVTERDMHLQELEEHEEHAEMFVDLLVSCIAKLSAEQVEIIKLYYYKGMKTKDIASSLGININTTVGRLRYARTNIQKVLSSEYVKMLH